MSVIKQFYKPDPVEIEIEFINGEKKIFVIEGVSCKQIKKLNEINQKYASDGKADAFSLIAEQISIFLGGKAEDFFDIDFNISKDILTYLLRLIKHPTFDKVEESAPLSKS